MTAISFERKLQIVNLKAGDDLSYRQTSAKAMVPKSTIHDNIHQFRAEVETFRAAIGVDPVERLVRAAIVLTMHGKCSSRNTLTNTLDIMIALPAKHFGVER